MSRAMAQTYGQQEFQFPEPKQDNVHSYDAASSDPQMQRFLFKKILQIATTGTHNNPELDRDIRRIACEEITNRITRNPF